MMATKTPESQIVRFDSTASSGQTIHKSSAWPIRRYTPYSKTPKSRKRYGIGQLERTPVLPEDLADLQSLLNKTWTVYQVTPMSDFKHDAASLKKYARHLSAFLQAESQKGIGVDMTNEVVDRAVFKRLKGLKTSTDDNEAVELKVKVKSQGTNSASTTGVTLTAVLCSVGADINRDQTLDDRLVLLPVLIMKGTVGVSKLVIKWLESQFDCHIRKMTFNPMTLAWTISLWAGAASEDGVKPVELQFTVPKHIEGLSRITLTIEQQDAQALWQSIHDDNSDEYTVEEVSAFIKSLEEHFFHHFKILLEGMTLTTVGTPLGFIGCEGKLKIFQEDGVIQVLQYLTELATDDISLNCSL